MNSRGGSCTTYALYIASRLWAWRDNCFSTLGLKICIPALKTLFVQRWMRFTLGTLAYRLPHGDQVPCQPNSPIAIWPESHRDALPSTISLAFRTCSTCWATERERELPNLRRDSNSARTTAMHDLGKNGWGWNRTNDVSNELIYSQSPHNQQ